MAERANLKDLLSSRNVEELRAVRDFEIQKYQTNKMILDILKSGWKRKFEGTTQNIEKSLKILSVQDYLRLENDEVLLGLNNLKIDLSYTETKTIKNFVKAEIKRKYIPVLEFINNKLKQYPDLFEPEKKQMEIVALEQKRRDTLLQLVELKAKKIHMLRNMLDIKLGPYAENELKLIRTQYNANHQKITLLNQFMAEEFVGRSDYTEKAVQEVVRFINAELEDK